MGETLFRVLSESIFGLIFVATSINANNETS